jgi:hypothetical protein
MALTLIRNKIPNSSNYVNMGFETQVVEDVTFLTIRTFDDEVKPVIMLRRYELLQKEEQFHKELRDKSAEKGHLITSHSTNPEWNPEGYVKTLKDFKDEKSNTRP